MNITIRCPQGAEEPLRFAAGELERYLTQMLAAETGELSVTLSVDPGEGNYPNDAFAVDLRPEGGQLSGNSPRAVLLGVYDCLRRLGSRFLGPGAQWEVIPALKKDALALRYAYTASFRHRGVCIEGADSRENVLDFIDWLPKAGYNSFFLQFKSPYAFLKRWYHHEGNPLVPAQPYTPEDARCDLALFERELKRRGLLLHKVGHGWTGEVLGYDALSWDADPVPLAPEKRPFAAMVGDVRGLWKGIPANTNLCLSNPAAVDSFASLVVDYARENPDADYLHVWLADEYNNACECDACRSSTPSDQYVELLNEIDRRLTAAGLSTRIVFLLYQELLWPPVRARLEHPERFVLMFAPISRTFEKSYRVEKRLPPIPPYDRNRITLPTDLSENLAFLRGWQELFRGDSFVYDYPLGRAHYGDFGYIKIARTISGDVKQLRALGLDGYVSCQELRSGLPNFFPNYVLGRTLMDEGADVNRLMEEYFSAAYGEDWPEVSDYLFRLSTLSSTDYVNGKGPRRDDAFAQRMDTVREVCLGFSSTLERHRRDTGWENPFWAALDFHRDYVRRLARSLRALALGDDEKAAQRRREFQQFICEHEPDFQSWLDVYRVLEVTEKYTGFPIDPAMK